jgi:hypothetical protein
MYVCDYHNFGHYSLSCLLLKNTVLQILDSVSVFRRNLNSWAQKIEVVFVSGSSSGDGDRIQSLKRCARTMDIVQNYELYLYTVAASVV